MKRKRRTTRGIEFKNNTKQFSDKFLRALLRWVCKQVGCKYSKIKIAEFGTRQTGWSGRCWDYGRIRVATCPDNGPEGDKKISDDWYRGRKRYPIGGNIYPGHDKNCESYRGATADDRLEAIVIITAHELTHLKNEGTRFWGCEARTSKAERDAIAAFRAIREQLVAEWSTEPAPKPKKSKTEVNEERARKNLANWEKKLKYAQNKVRKYRTSVRYYDRKATAAKGDE